jgi:hypothetical protein
VAQAVECLPGKLKALSSNPTTAMTKKRKKKNILKGNHASPNNSRYDIC